MKLKRREMILAWFAGGLIVMAAGWFLLLGGDSRSLGKLRAERDRLAAEVDGKQKLLEAAGRDGKRLAQWQQRSLPSDPGIARSLYQSWLRGLANRVNFRQLNIESKEVESRRNMFMRESFSLHGHAALPGLIQFLYEFYSAGHLHQIRQMDFKPLENSAELDVNLSIEALSLPGADGSDKLSEEPGHGLRLAKLDEYLEPIAKRNLFAAFKPARVETTMDVTGFAFVTGFTEVSGVRQVWIQDRITGKTWQLREGEGFQVGQLQGTVRTIAPTHEVIVDFDGHRRRLRDGENLRGGVEVQP